MPRQPKVRKKKVGKSSYWYTEAGGETYFGNVNDVPYAEAQKLFAEHLKNVVHGNRKLNTLTCAELIEHFLEWVKLNRAEANYKRKKQHCNEFGNFRSKGQRIADLPANRVRDSDLTNWLRSCQTNRKNGPQTLLHRYRSILHCWNWGTRNPSPDSHLPPSFRPFAAVEPPRVPRSVLTEDDLIRDDEIDTLFKAAEVDLDAFHSFGPKHQRERNPYKDFADMLRCYQHTGARTGELAKVEVADFQPRTRQVVLGNHKTSKSQRDPLPRGITLNDEAMAVFDAQCSGKNKKDRVFTTSDGKPWATRSLPARLDRVKEIAKQEKLGCVRGSITIYSFRHLWISEIIMAGVDVATVARMAGTSISMIERTYGHFRHG